MYLMRHGIAAEGPGPWKSDRERPLSDHGIQQTERAAKGLVAAGIGFDRILSSPLLRAAQTARIVTGAQGGGVEVEEIEALASGFVQEELFRALRRLSGENRVLLVGHEPDMGTLAASLLGLPAERSIPFGKGAIARIDVDGLPPSRSGSLVWLLTARLAGALAG
jgi:phosphohistidine phosphatase